MKTLLWLSSCCVLLSCTSNLHSSNSSEPSPPVQNASSPETFDAFFVKFQTDSVFQKSRIQFPLKFTLLGGEGESDSTKFITKSKLTFIGIFSSADAKKIVKKVQLGPAKIKIRFQIDDTGFEQDFNFVKKNNKWYLAFVVDCSD